MLVVPIQQIPSQTISVILAGQACRINIYQRTTGLYVDLLLNDVLVVGGVIALDRNLIVRSVYLGFVGDLAFVDTQGSQDPDYTGAGSRFLLVYAEPSELPVLFAEIAVGLWVPANAEQAIDLVGVPPGPPVFLSIS